MSHPLISGGAPSQSAPAVSPDADVRIIDGTPATLAALLIGSAVLLAAVKAAGFKLVIGVGG